MAATNLEAALLPDFQQVPRVRHNDEMPLVLPVQHSTFSSLFNDPTQSQMNQRQIVMRFQPGHIPAINLASLLDAAIAAPWAGGFLCCTGLHANLQPRVYCIHTLSRYVGSLDGEATPWDDRYFATLGDVMGDVSVTVALPDTAFNLTPAAGIRAYTTERIVAGIANIPDGSLFPNIAPSRNGVSLPPNVTLIRARHCMYLPAKYVPLVLSTKGYTLKQAWEILIPAMQQDNALVEVEPIVTWLRAALMNNGTGVPSVGIALSSVTMDSDLYEHRYEIIRHLLPGLGNQSQQMLSPAIYKLAQQVANSTAEMRTSRLKAENAKLEPKTPMEKFGLLTDSLLQYMQVENKNYTAPFLAATSSNYKKNRNLKLFMNTWMCEHTRVYHVY
jgi:hypothetical protein